MNTEPKLLTITELAEMLRTTPAGIRNRIYRGQIPREAILRANGSSRGKLLFRRAIIEKHYRIGAPK